MIEEEREKGRNIYVVPVGEVQYKYITISTRNDPVLMKMKIND